MHNLTPLTLLGSTGHGIRTGVGVGVFARGGVGFGATALFGHQFPKTGLIYPQAGFSGHLDESRWESRRCRAV